MLAIDCLYLGSLLLLLDMQFMVRQMESGHISSMVKMFNFSLLRLFLQLAPVQEDGISQTKAMERNLI